MEIQMIAAEVGENCGVKLNAENPSQRQRVRGNFHYKLTAASRFEIRSHADDIQRLRRRIGRRPRLARDPVLDGADQSRYESRLAQNRVYQVRCRGFAVRSSDARERHAPVRVIVKIQRGLRQRPPSVLHLNPAAGEAVRRGKLAHHRRRATAQRIGRKARPIHARSCKRKEQKILPYAARVILQPAHGFPSQPRRELARQLHTVQHLANGHGYWEPGSGNPAHLRPAPGSHHPPILRTLAGSARRAAKSFPPAGPGYGPVPPPASRPFPPASPGRKIPPAPPAASSRENPGPSAQPPPPEKIAAGAHPALEQERLPRPAAIE